MNWRRVRLEHARAMPRPPGVLATLAEVREWVVFALVVWVLVKFMM